MEDKIKKSVLYGLFVGLIPSIIGMLLGLLFSFSCGQDQAALINGLWIGMTFSIFAWIFWGTIHYFTRNN